ncbi:hypothetical protein TNIN_342981 [Trichonephila inaurata madagascariensis]|uniref:Uncharacterized protein n=1 Tax=Trichonephila inaurata madagascariensis TaxID=2747483 RepID=A0A8X6YST6_9ARAC|nr:hypothetical protein TNIN_342981 [Trichonephila inaurata madagascariensis]
MTPQRAESASKYRFQRSSVKRGVHSVEQACVMYERSTQTKSLEFAASNIDLIPCRSLLSRFEELSSVADHPGRGDHQNICLADNLETA